MIDYNIKLNDKNKLKSQISSVIKLSDIDYIQILLFKKRCCIYLKC
jgi:hypothetical protein